MIRLVPACCAAVALIASSAPPPQALAAARSATRAAIVYNVLRFAEWPSARFTSTRSAITLCVRSDDSVFADFGSLGGKLVHSRPLEVRRVTGAFGGDCHAAYVSEDVARPREIDALNRAGTLTIGSAPNFSASGAIGLVTIGRQVRFQVNTSAADIANVKLSSQLLRLALRIL